MSKNPKCQFVIKSLTNIKALNEAHTWCLENLPLKNEKGISLWPTELFIVTSSQMILNKLNKHFGSKFTFDGNSFWDNRIFYID